MHHEIIWRQSAFEQMAELVRVFADRAAEFSAALRQLTAMLRRNPSAEGESRAVPYRVGFFGRLTVYYRIDTATRTVYVISVHLPADRI